MINAYFEFPKLPGQEDEMQGFLNTYYYFLLSKRYKINKIYPLGGFYIDMAHMCKDDPFRKLHMYDNFSKSSEFHFIPKIMCSLGAQMIKNLKFDLTSWYL